MTRHLQAGCHKPGSAAEPYARQSSTDYLYFFIAGNPTGHAKPSPEKVPHTRGGSGPPM